MTVENAHGAHKFYATRPAVGRGLQSRRRWPAMLMLVVAGEAHIPLVAPHLEKASIPACFLSFSSLPLSYLLQFYWSGIRRQYGAVTAITPALAFLAYVLSRTVGLPEVENGI